MVGSNFVTKEINLQLHKQKNKLRMQEQNQGDNPQGPLKTPRFLLEKRPNLLSYTLTIPLVSKDATAAEVRAVAAKLGESGNKGTCPVRTSKFPSLVSPSLTASKRQDGTCTVSVFAPFSNRSVPEAYLSVSLDTHVDIDRSILTLHGDHLAARLAFASYSSARDAHIEREAKRPTAVELNASAYSSHGVQCRACESPIVPPQKIFRVYRSPRMPWGELLDSLTCVKPEEYRQSETIDNAFKYSNGRVSPQPGSVLVSETYVAIHGSDAIDHSIVFEAPSMHQASLLFDESEESGKFRAWHVVKCSRCCAWLGDAYMDDCDSKTTEVRLFKANIQAAVLFADYKLESIVCGATLDAALMRECYRFVFGYAFGGEQIPIARLVLLSYDTWIKTENDADMAPILKFLYWDVPLSERQSAEVWAKRTSAEWIVLPSETLARNIIQLLRASTKTLPLSLQSFPDGSLLGYLYW